jgi:hypothetical protein
VVWREAVMAWILGDIGDPDRRSVGPAMDEDAVDPVPNGEDSDRSTLLRRDAGRDELGQPPLLDHAKRTVTGAGDLGGELDDALEHSRERELGCEHETGLDQLVTTIHATSLAWRTPPTRSHTHLAELAAFVVARGPG